MAKSIFDIYGTNAAKENEGVWIPFSDDREFLIARAGNEAFKKAMEREQKAASHNGAVKIPPKTQEEILKRVAAKTILLGWRGDVLGEDLTPLPYSYENALRLLEVKDLREEILKHSLEMKNYQDEEDAAAEKN